MSPKVCFYHPAVLRPSWRCTTLRQSMYTVYQTSSCSLSSLIFCKRCFFFSFFACPPHFAARLCSRLPSRLSTVSLQARVEPPAAVCLRTPSTHPPLPLCLQEFVPHYRSLLHPNQPSHPAWCHCCSMVLSHYLCRHQRGRVL